MVRSLVTRNLFLSSCGKSMEWDTEGNTIMGILLGYLTIILADSALRSSNDLFKIEDIIYI